MVTRLPVNHTNIIKVMIVSLFLTLSRETYLTKFMELCTHILGDNKSNIGYILLNACEAASEYLYISKYSKYSSFVTKKIPMKLFEELL